MSLKTPSTTPKSHRLLKLTSLILILTIPIMLVFTTDPQKRWPLYFGQWRMRWFVITLFLLYCAATGFLLTRSRRTIFKWFAASFLLAATITLLELFSIFGFVSYTRAFGLAPQKIGAQAIPNFKYEGHSQPDIAWLFGYDAENIPISYQTDSRGYRNQHDRKEADVYLLGDSILVAGLIPFDQTVTARLEQSLQRPVMNISLIGLSVQAERDHFINADLNVKNKVVLHFIFEGNDILDSQTYHRLQNEPFITRTARTSFTKCALIRIQQFSDPRPRPKPKSIGQINGVDYPFNWINTSFQAIDTEFTNITNAILDLKKHVEEQGGTYKLVYIPAKIRVLGPIASFPDHSTIKDYRNHLNPLRKKLTQWASQQNISLIDTTDPLLASAKAGQIPFFRLDTHTNQTAHQILQKTLTSHLNQHFANLPTNPSRSIANSN